MKRYKYREYLQNRTIDPSSGSWDKLATKLDANENKRRSRNWMLLKIASFILLLVSVGIYYFQPIPNAVPVQEIAAPVSVEDLKDIPGNEVVTETEIVEISNPPYQKSTPPENQSADKPDVLQIAKNPSINSEETELSSAKIASSKSLGISKTRDDPDFKIEKYEQVAAEISSSEDYSVEDELLDQEIDQLLHDSKLKLIVNGQISTKKYVNTDALLNSVEDDLDKDLRQKLIEKIVNTLKKDKEVVTSEEN